jgi:predicted dehydrogenase
MKVLMVGLGSIGQRHVRNMRTLMGSELQISAWRSRGLPHVLTDRMEIEAGRRVEDAYSIRTFADLESALEDGPDVVFICNPSSLHVPTALAAARSGRSLFIEKPLSHSMEGVPDLIAAVERRRLVALVGYQLRFHPCLVRLRTLLDRQSVGRIRSAHLEIGEYLPWWHPYEDYRKMYAARADLGGGVLLTQIHELDYAFWLFGLPKRIYASGSGPSGLEVDVEDTADMLMECEYRGCPMTVAVHLDYLQRPATRSCRIYGDDGRILLDLLGPFIHVYDRTGRLAESTEFPDFQRNQLYLDELRHFFACLRGEQSPVASVRDAAQSLAMALAAKESIAQGRAVDLT